MAPRGREIWKICLSKIRFSSFLVGFSEIDLGKFFNPLAACVTWKGWQEKKEASRFFNLNLNRRPSQNNTNLKI